MDGVNHNQTLLGVVLAAAAGTVITVKLWNTKATFRLQL